MERSIMARETTMSGRLGKLARFSVALAANAPELDYLEGARLRLERSVGEAQEIAKQQAAFIANKQEASQKLKVTVNEAERLATGIRRIVTENYGVRAEKLAEFGLQPFRGRKLNREAPEPAASPAAPLDTNS
jgi:hypothetical protein